MNQDIDVKAYVENYQKAYAVMKEQLPNVVNGFGALFSKVMGEGVLSVKGKELMALAIGVAIQCEPCIRLHTSKSLKVGATKEEILEAASVAVAMAGGPAYTQIPMVMQTIESLQGGKTEGA